MTDTKISALMGTHSWTRRPVWFWQVASMEKDGWYKGHASNPIRPVMIFRHEEAHAEDTDNWVPFYDMAHGFVGIGTGIAMTVTNDTNAVLRKCRVGRIRPKPAL